MEKVPSKIVCVGLNYKDHAKEVDLPLPNEPLLFLKPSTTVIKNGENVIYPPETEQVDYEAELAVIIGQKAKDISIEQAFDFIDGFSCANDVTARDLQFSDGQWTRGKSFDTFCPIGNVITKGVNLDDSTIELRVNGELKQQSNVNQLIFPVDYLVSYISHVMTLLPGDVILTGTPHGVGSVQPGDEMEVKIDGIGTLKNKIVRKECALLL
ncbi:fumarylacetoacetate hydrolase family protein [Alteribacter populi]|uniref:fumarylacetoacetate hydrolase family protein n=1 Tax=Alteribacter populi TaxID=2011011 RepID=UPI000BBB3268|nr:fumarylacetoacetate hydrolase family protein [Alteribacter populi]